MAYLNGHLGSYDAATGQWRDARVALTTDEAAAVQAELTNNPTGRPYRNGDNSLKSGDELAALMDGSYLTDNPVTSAPLIPLETVSRHEFGVWMSTMMARIMLGGNSALISKWTALNTAITPLTNFQDSIPVASQTMQGILGQLVSDGVATQADVDGFDKAPDPKWDAELTQPSRTSVVLTARPLVLDSEDFGGMN